MRSLFTCAGAIISLSFIAFSFNSCKKDHGYVPEPLPPITPTQNPIPYSVMAYYIVPTDRAINPDVYRAVKSALVNLQGWYKTQMGNGKTFTLNPVVLDTLSATHNAKWFITNNGDSISGNNFYIDNTKYELKLFLGSKYDSVHIAYMAFVDADFYNTTVPGGPGVEGSYSLAGLAGPNPDSWTGDAGHALGHAFGLKDGYPPNSDGIMSKGWSNYPNCVLKPWDIDSLNVSPFFTVH
jgi:hypothetical protein